MPEQPQLTVIFDSDYAAHAHAILAELRGRWPASPARTSDGRTVWLVTRDQDVRKGFLDSRLPVAAQCRRPATQASRRAIDVTLMHQSGKNHSRLRSLAAATLAPRHLEAYRAQIDAVAVAVLGAIEATGVVDLLAAFSQPFTFQALSEVFGVPQATRADLDRWMSSAFSRAGRGRDEIESNMDCFEAFIRTEIRRRRRNPGPDLISEITSAWVAEGSSTEDEVVSLCAMLMLAGFESTMQMIGFSVVGLLTRPELYVQLRDNSALIPQAVEELLRWDTPGPFSTPRLATESITYGEVTVPEGSTVLLSMAAANRDPSRHERPDEIDFDKPAPRHLSFGMGSHYCLGASLARLELSVALASLLKHYPRMELAVAPASLVWRGNHSYRRLVTLPVMLGGPE